MRFHFIPVLVIVKFSLLDPQSIIVLLIFGSHTLLPFSLGKDSVFSSYHDSSFLYCPERNVTYLHDPRGREQDPKFRILS